MRQRRRRTAHLELSGEGELELAVHALVLGVRVEGILDRDVDGSVEVESVNLGWVTGEGCRKEKLLALWTRSVSKDLPSLRETI